MSLWMRLVIATDQGRAVREAGLDLSVQVLGTCLVLLALVMVLRLLWRR